MVGGAYQAGTGVDQIGKGEYAEGMANLGLGSAAVLGSGASTAMLKPVSKETSLLKSLSPTKTQAKVAGVAGGGVNFGMQLYKEGGNIDNIDEAEVAMSTILSAGTAAAKLPMIVTANYGGSVFLKRAENDPNPLIEGVASGAGSAAGFGIGKTSEFFLGKLLKSNSGIITNSTSNIFDSLSSETISNKIMDIYNARNDKVKND